jgi:hypothetical protein
MSHSPQSFARRLAPSLFLPAASSYHEVLTVAQLYKYDAACTEADAARPDEGSATRPYVSLSHPHLRPCFASVTCPCCRLGLPGPRSPTPRLLVLQERRPRGRLTTRPPPPLSAPALAAFPRAAFSSAIAPVNFVCTRDGRALRFVHAAAASSRVRSWRFTPSRPPHHPQVRAKSLNTKR